MTSKNIKAGDFDLKEKVVAVKRVSKTTKGGRKLSLAALVVVGNGKGVVGYGLGKAREVSDAIVKGVEDAKKNLISIPILRDTLPHETVGKFCGGKVLLKPAAPGTGIIAGGGARIVLESAGVNNVLSKSKGSSSPHNVVKATFQALLQLRDPASIAAHRGITLDKVFNG